jgi:AraC family transcriptional regulator
VIRERRGQDESEPWSLTALEAKSLGKYDGRFVRCVEVLYPPNLSLPPHAHDRPSVSVCLSGSVEESVEGRAFTVGVSSVFIRPASAVHENRFGHGHLRALTLELLPEAVLLHPRLEDLLREARVFESSAITGVARRISRELRNAGDDFRPLMIDALSLELIVLLLRAATDENPGPRTSWVAEAVEYLSGHFLDSITVNELAARFVIHPTHFGRVFKREMHCSVAQHIQYLRTEMGADLLRTSDETIAEIGIRCGFADQAHFTRVFKEIVGTTPSSYRRVAKR